MTHDVDVQALAKTVVLTIDGAEYTFTTEEANKLSSDIDTATGSKRNMVVNNFFTTAPVTDKLAEEVSRGLFWSEMNK